MKFYSQQGEDFFVYRFFINQKRDDGIFVELGAFDGETYSNTKFFEENLKFKGVLIEPIPNMFKKLIINRQNSICYDFAISNEVGTVEFIGDGATSGIEEVMTNKFKDNWHKNSRKYIVNCCPIKDLLQKSNIKYIDFFSIDVEGGEKMILDTMDWSIDIYVICIELDGHNVEKDEYCRNILKEKGFRFEMQMCINEFWVNHSYKRKDLLYKKTKLTFTNILDYGQHKYIENHCIPIINNSIKEYMSLHK
jgi:FkbM family methyltransferase